MFHFIIKCNFASYGVQAFELPTNFTAYQGQIHEGTILGEWNVVFPCKYAVNHLQNNKCALRFIDWIRLEIHYEICIFSKFILETIPINLAMTRLIHMKLLE